MPRQSTGRIALDQASILSLRIFNAVAELRSFSTAARQLRLSPSVVTNHVLALERATGVALFHRTTWRVAITEAGERFYRRCTVIIQEIEKAVSGVAPDRDQRAHLRVTAPPAFALTILGPHLPTFMHQYPSITIDLMVTSAVPNMVSERIDITFVLRDELDSKLPHIRLAPSGRAFCASPKYLAARGTPESPADLARHQCLANIVAGVSEGWSVRLGRKRRQVQVEAQLLADNGEVLRMACLRGAGIGNFYRFHVREDLERGDLVEVLHSYQPDTNFLYAITPHREMILPQVELFIDFVKSVVTGEPFQENRGAS